MAKRPMPVPRNRRGAPGARVPRQKPRPSGPKPHTVLAAVLLVLLLACGCIAALASSGPDGAGAYESRFLAIRARWHYTYPTSTVGIARSLRGPMSTSQPRDHGDAAIATTHSDRFGLKQGPEANHYSGVADRSSPVKQYGWMSTLGFMLRYGLDEWCATQSLKIVRLALS